MHGLALFQCAPYAARLTVSSCAQRYLEANDARGRSAERIIHCRGCAIGAAHAGVSATHFSRFYDTNLCPRCHKTWLRIIGGRICVSCYNREREFAAGRNAKGIYPAGVRAVWLLTITASVDLRHVRYQGMAHNNLELALHTLRVNRGRIFFSFTPDVSNIRQGRLI